MILGELRCANRNRSILSQLILDPWVLMTLVRSLFVQEFEESGGFAFGHRYVGTPGSLGLLWWYLCMYLCGTGSALGVDRNQKSPVPGCSWAFVSSGFWAGSSEMQWWSYLCSQASLHSWVVSYLPEPPGYGTRW